MVALCHWWDRGGVGAQLLPRPKRLLLPDEFYEPLPGGFTHVLLINSHNLVTSQELVLRGASCRGEERGMRAWSHCWESAGLGGSHQCLREQKGVREPVGRVQAVWACGRGAVRAMAACARQRAED